MRWLLLLSFLLTGCGPVGLITTLGCASGYLGYQHSKSGGLKYCFKNTMLKAKIEDVWEDADLDEPFLKVYVAKGVPVIVGAATSKEKLEQAKALALMKAENVQCLADDSIKGGWNYDLELNIRCKLTFNSKVSARNYHIKAIKGRVWIVGVAQTEAEKQEVISKLQTMKGVESFNYHIIVSPDYLQPGSVEIATETAPINNDNQ